METKPFRFIKSPEILSSDATPASIYCHGQTNQTLPDGGLSIEKWLETSSITTRL